MPSSQIAKILRGKIWRCFGGIKPQELKNTSQCPIEELPLPSLITLPLDRHLGEGGEILVQTGNYVKAGQALTRPGGRRNVPLHASTSGTVVSIGMQVLPHPSGFSGRCITIKPDGLDAAVDPEPIPDWRRRTPQELLERIRQFGIEGLGGAQFQTAAKLSSAIEGNRICHIFIVNGAECEPVATCDDRLMQERAADIVQGIEIVKQILKPQLVIVAIEDNKPEAIKAMREAAGDRALIRVIPTRYPSGAARNLIKIVTGIEIPYKAHTSDCGIVVDNVETVFALKQAVIDGIPLTRRVVTVAGENLQQQGNAVVRLGTSVRFVLNHFHLKPERRQRIILGGPLMGFTLPSVDVPVTKSATCIFAPSSREVPPEEEPVNCIRCGRCARACPSRLVPYQMYAYSRAGDHEHAKKCGISDCTECGCCAFVCPSRIRLTTQFRREKAIQSLLRDNERRNERARERMAARQERLSKEEAVRAEKKKAALARIKAQQEAAAKAGSTAARTAAGAVGGAAGAAAPAADEALAKRRAAAIEAARLRAAQKRKAAAVAGQAEGSADQIIGSAAPAGSTAAAESSSAAGENGSAVAAPTAGESRSSSTAAVKPAAPAVDEATAKRRAAAIAAARLRAEQKRKAAAAAATGQAEGSADQAGNAQANGTAVLQGANAAAESGSAAAAAATVTDTADTASAATAAVKPAAPAVDEATAKRRAAAIAAARLRAEQKRKAAAAAENGSTAAGAEDAGRNLPQGLRRGSEPKKPGIVQNSWDEPAPQVPSGIKEENPPRHDIEAVDRPYHSIFANPDAAAGEHRLPPQLSRNRKKD